MPFMNGVEQSHVVMPAPASPSTNGSREATQPHTNGNRVYPTAAAAMEPIAVVGMALKFPQDATSPSTFWDMLARGASARTEVPGNRFNAKAFFKPDRNKTGTVSGSSLSACMEQYVQGSLTCGGKPTMIHWGGALVQNEFQRSSSLTDLSERGEVLLHPCCLQKMLKLLLCSL
jgi:hypothetical protein